MRLATTLVATLAAAGMMVAPAAEAQTETWNDYTRFFDRAAGQFWAITGDTTPHDQNGWRNQWATVPQSGGTAPGAVTHIQWGSPDAWPPASYERFKRSDDGAWVLLDGFGNADGMLKQRVTREVISSINCVDNQVTLPLAEPEVINGVTMGKQHYAKWDVTGPAYCLKTWGKIIIPGGTDVNFYHQQGYWPPSGPTCSNTYFANQKCIKQYEVWADDNPGNAAKAAGTIEGLNLIHKRDNIKAKGKGSSYIHYDYLARNGLGWQADGRYYWTH